VQAQSVNKIADAEAARRQAGDAAWPRSPGARAIGMHGQTVFSRAWTIFRAAAAILRPNSPVCGQFLLCRTGWFLRKRCETGRTTIAEGRYEESEVILNEILTDAYNPNCREARTLLTHLHDPVTSTKDDGTEVSRKVEEVKKLLTESGRVLSIGPLRIWR